MENVDSVADWLERTGNGLHALAYDLRKADAKREEEAEKKKYTPRGEVSIKERVASKITTELVKNLEAKVSSKELVAKTGESLADVTNTLTLMHRQGKVKREWRMPDASKPRAHPFYVYWLA